MILTTHLFLLLSIIIFFYAGIVWTREGIGKQNNMMNLGKEVLPIFLGKIIEGSIDVYYCFATHLFLLSSIIIILLCRQSVDEGGNR